MTSAPGAPAPEPLYGGDPAKRVTVNDLQRAKDRGETILLRNPFDV